MRLINYYGGKERMLDILKARIPEHKTYVEGKVEALQNCLEIVSRSRAIYYCNDHNEIFKIQKI